MLRPELVSVLVFVVGIRSVGASVLRLILIIHFTSWD